MDDNFAAVVEQDVFVDGAVVFDREVIAKRKFHAMKYFDVAAAMLENVARKHGTHFVP